MFKPREWDCGVWDRGAHFGRVTVREKDMSLFEIVIVSYRRPELHKTEELVAVAHELSEAKRQGWELSYRLNKEIV